MHRDFRWLYEKHGDEARNILERICLEVLEFEYPSDEVQDVRTTQGDGGIDVFISHENKDFSIFQCKFYLDDLNSSRKSSIKKSFERAVETKGDILTKWVLCTPRVFSNKEHDWWEDWKKSTKENFESTHNRKLKIGLLSGNKLMRRIKKYKLYEEYFEVERVDEKLVDKILKNYDKKMIKDDNKIIHDKLYILAGQINSGEYFESNLVDNIDQVMYLKDHKLFKGNDFFYYLSELGMTISKNAGIDPKQKTHEHKENYRKTIFELRKKAIKEYRKLNI